MKRQSQTCKIFLLAAALIFAIGSSFGQTQTFTTNGSFTVPAGVTSITVECWGGGGRGGSAILNGVSEAGGGGGGGAYSKKIVSVISGNLYSVFVGVGGFNDATLNGGDSYFINIGTIIGRGGKGVATNALTGGNKGTWIVGDGDSGYNGGNGATGVASSYGGGGGSSGGINSNGNDGSTSNGGTAPTGGAAGGNGSTVNGNPGLSGSAPGAGGGGATKGTGSLTPAGGNGANGQVLVTWAVPYYSQGSASPAVLANWNTNPGGGGSSPSNFTNNNQAFIIQNGHTMTTTGTAWTVSGTGTKVVIQSGGTLTETASAISLSANTALKVDNGALLNHNVNSLTIFNVTVTFGNTSTVSYGLAGAQTVYPSTYGNLTISGSGTKTFSAATTINGNMSISSGVVANLGTFTSSANTLTLGGLGQNSGSWGSTSSSATNKNNTYFSATAGIVNVISSCVALMGYGYERNITIDYTKVSGGTDLSNFPVLVNLTGQNFLKQSPTGQVFNTNGYDIIFTDNNYNKLDHQIEYFNGTNGDYVAWVRIPTLSSTSNTIIKILYGNQQVTTDPSVTSVWDSHYKGVWHLDNNSLSDFTSFNKSATPFLSPTYLAGNIYNALGLDGGTQYAQVINAPNTNFSGNLTVSAWIYLNGLNLDQKIAGNQNGTGGGYKFGVFTNNKVEFEIRNAANNPSLNRAEPGGITLTTGQWYYVAGISSDVLDSIKTFVSGIPERPFKKTGTIVNSSNDLTIGKEPFSGSAYWNGRIDELRVSDKVRSNGWMKTEFNNQSSPSTFYALDAVGVISNNLLSASICTGPITLTFGYPSGGVYSGNPFIAGNVFTPPSAGTYSITYTFNGGCGPTSVTKNFIITGIPSAPVASNKEYCVNQIAYLEATSGKNIRWYSSGTLVSTANPFSTGLTTAGTYNYTVTQTINGCESSATTVSLTVFSSITINTQPLPSSICNGGNATFTVAASGINVAYQWQENSVNISNGGIYSGATTATLTLTNPGIAKNGKIYRCVVSSSCGTSPVNSNTGLLTVTPLPVATFSYSGTPYCQNALNPSPTFSGGGVAGTFSSATGLIFVSTATGQVNLAASTGGAYTVTNTIAASGGCGIVTATSPITIISDLIWTGAVSSDWNVTGNWSCGYIPGTTTLVQIPNVPNKPVISGGAIGAVNNLIIDIGSSLTISGNTIQISGTITNNGTFTATNGSIEMKGSAAQLIGANIFAGNTIKDLKINNAAGISLLGSLNVTGIVTVQNGNLLSGGFLTLSSTAAGTALISGSGSGTVTGNVTMQRYLPSGYGYKYFSSPFNAATVNEFTNELITGLYRYDENRLVSGIPATGWVNYKIVANVLNPLAGYAVNFGSSAVANTVDVTGVVNNGSVSVTLYNHNQIYTKGFNLIGNPYPSPIDWNAGAGWTKTNIDNALYYFRASTTDQYGGTYSTYINGISSDGLASNVIPSMQGFFVHVTNGTFPVTASLSMNNSVRITNQTSPFAKSAHKGSVPLLRLVAGYSDDTTSFDPVVVYFDYKATSDFDSQLDALKLFNTDTKVPNLYAVSSNGSNLSINALPSDFLTSFTVPLGLKTNKNGEIIFKVRSLSLDFPEMRIYLTDVSSGTEMDILPGKEYKVSLSAADYKNRFFLNFSNIATDIPDINPAFDLFSIYSSHGILKANINLLSGENGILTIYNLTGQAILVRKIYEPGYYEFNPNITDGIYVVSFVSGNKRISKKIHIQNQ